jgi:site-specific DNA-adenine methylase
MNIDSKFNFYISFADNPEALINAVFKLFQDNTSKMIYDWLMNYNVHCICKHFLKDHRIMSYCTTESVDGQSDYYRAGIRQNLVGH